MNEFRCIWDEVLEFPVYGVDREDSILADIRMTVFEARPTDRNQRFKNLHILGDLLEEAESSASNVLIGVLLSYIRVSDIISCTHAKLPTRSLRMALLESCQYRTMEQQRITYTTKIISCFSFPLSSYFGQTSQ